MTNQTPKEILVTSALPYANGAIHLGHMLEYIQTDIWVRYQRLVGHTCYYVCADDTHGTAIMLRAEAEDITPEALIARVQTEHEHDFARFGISFDNYYSTHSEENRLQAEHIYQVCKQSGHITKRTITQSYDPEKNMFLADRFIKGTCPKCHTDDQYGDNCEACGATYAPTDLINPKSTVSGATPIIKESEHLFFRLAHFTDLLNDWVHSGSLQPQIANKLSEWLEQGLQDWDISRDGPYFGFAIPEEDNKFFYVWLDAPIGYMASFQSLCAQSERQKQDENLNFHHYFKPDSPTELYHFIGKDIINFHGLFWPAMLHGAGYRMPTGVFAHGFVLVNGQKMSKSRGTFIQADTYLQHLNPECLRYYFAAKLNARIEDFDLNLDDFMQRINADLVGKVVNIASRCAGYINKQCQHQLSGHLDNPTLTDELIQAQTMIAELYQNREFSKVVSEIMALADKANQYIADKAPWALAKQVGQEEQVQAIYSQGINLFRIIMIYLQPIIPSIAQEVESFLNTQLTWNRLNHSLLKHTIKPYRPLLTRITPDQVKAMLEASKEI